MRVIRGMLDYSVPWTMPDIYLFTGNPIRRKDGAIVMGRGAAKQVRDTYPGVGFRLGEIIEAHPTTHLAWTTVALSQCIGWFKVKHHWRDAADLNLIRESARQLSVYADIMRGCTFHMNFPGIGNGRLPIEEVERVLSEELDGNIWVYRS